MLDVRVRDVNYLPSLLEGFRDSLGGNLDKIGKEEIFNCDNNNARGIIRCSFFKDGLSFIDFDLNFYQDTSINVDTSEVNKLYFIYCLEGQFELQLEAGGPVTQLEDYQSAVISTSKLDQFKINFKKGMKAVVNMICFDREIFVKSRGYLSNSKDPLNILFSQVDGQAMLFFGNYDHKIAEQVRMLKAIEQSGLLRNIIIESQVNLILASQLQYYLQDTQADHRSSGLTKMEIEKAMRMADHIREYPNKPHTIKILSKREGLSAGKMQTAFKYLYERTVSDFVKEIRLEKAEELIATTDLSISEVVYAVGFNSRSYFSKIFKEKYKYSPRRYKYQG